MPIKLDTETDIPRIYHNGDKIRRIYKGDKELVYGLYDVHYYDRDNIDIYKPKMYAGGYGPEVVDFPQPNDAPDYFSEYKTHYGDSVGDHGGYEDNGLVAGNQKEGILIDDHRDLHMYSRGRQHKYSFSGTISYEVWRKLRVNTLTEPPMPNDSPYPWDGSPGISMPNCTWYVYYRAQQAGATPPTGSGFGNACNWIHDSSLGAGGTAIEGETNFAPGDIICYDEITPGDGGHVAFVEGDGEISGSWWTPLSTQRDLYDTAGELAEYIFRSGGTTNQYRYGHKGRSVSEEFGGEVQGVLRYSGW